MTFAEIVADRSQGVAQVLDPDKITLDSLGVGVLFVLAVWSGQALSGLRILAEVLRLHDREQRIMLWVCDSDALTEDSIAALGFEPQGWGEAVWLEDGRVTRLLDCRTPGWASQIDNKVREITQRIASKNP